MKTPEEIAAELKAAVDESDKKMADLLKKQDEEIAGKLGATSTATAAAIKAEGEKWAQVQADLKGTIDGQKARIDELEKKYQRPGWNGGAAGDGVKSLGEQFIEMLQADGGIQIKDLQSGGTKQSRNLVVNGGMSQFPAFGRNVKANILTTDATRLVPPMRDLMVTMPERVLRIRDLLEVVPTTVGSYEYIEEQGFGAETASAVTSITRSSQVATVTAAAAHGLVTGNVVQISGAVETEYNGIFIVTVTSATVFTYVVTGTPTTPATGTIVFRNLSAHGAAAVVAEAGTKPEATIRFVLRTGTVDTIAHWIPASRQVLSDLSQLRSMIDNRLLYGLGSKEEKQILYGSGSGQLTGIMVHSGVQALTASTPITSLGLLRTAITKVAIAEFPADGIVIGHTDWERVETVKGSDGHYIWANVPDGIQPRVWRLPVVVTSAMLDGSALVGAFNLGATLYDREDANVRFSESHASFFIQNLLAILAEERVGLAIKRPQSFVNVTFGSTV